MPSVAKPARAIPDRVPMAKRRGENQVPTNQRLWSMVQRQARAKFEKFPSPAASSWMRRRYLDMGGRYRNTKNKEDSKLAAKNQKSKSRSEKKFEKQEKESNSREAKTTQTISRQRVSRKRS